MRKNVVSMNVVMKFNKKIKHVETRNVQAAMMMNVVTMIHLVSPRIY